MTMEQKCKIGGESLRNRDAVNKDRISELPEDLLRKILSSVPARNVIATSVLSKRWRSLWKLVPNLKFVSDHHVKHTSSENVYKTLILHKAPFLESLHLMIEDEGDCLDIGILIGIAFARNVCELVLGLFIKDDKLVTFASVLFSCNNTLETLTLDGCILLDFPSRVCLKSLRKLHLDYVEFKDEESVCNLLCGCPSLQDLYVRPNGNISVTTFTIAVPSLQRLTIEDDYVGEGDGGYVISAPSLRYLSIKGVNNLEFCLIENAPELLEAKVIDASNISNENILASLTSAKCLTLSSIEIKYPTGSIFYQLVSLELGIDKSNWWNLLPLMLDSSPKLQILKLIDPNRSSDKDLVGWKNIQPKCVPECLLLHLETFVWTRYEWQREDEKEVAMYILKNARRLKKATLSTKPIQREELQKLKRRCKMLKKLAREVMASISCDRKSSIVRNSVSCDLKSSMVRNSVSCSLVLESN